MPKRQGYWKAYDASQKYDDLKIFSLIATLVNAKEKPFRKKSRRGRPLKFEERLYAQYIILVNYKGYSYREAERSAPLFLKDTMDHSTFGKTLLKIPEKYIKNIIKLLDELISGFLKYVVITDSSGVETDRYKRLFRKLTRMLQRIHLKLHIIVKYFYEVGVISITLAGVSNGYAHDSPQFRKIFEPVFKKTLFFGDSAYHAEKNFELLENSGLKQVIRMKEVGFVNELGEDLYKKFRGVIEGVFGGLESSRGIRTRCRLDHTRRISILLLALRHNINAYIKAIEIEKNAMRFHLFLIFSTAPFGRLTLK